MKIERLTDRSVQIELSVPEMEKRSLNISKLNVDAPAYKKLVDDMVSYAEIELGITINAVKVDSFVADNNSEIRFVLESIDPEDGSVSGGEDQGTTVFSGSDRKKAKETVRTFSPVYSRSGSRPAETASGSEAGAPGGGGFDLTAELMRRMMIDGYLFMQASALKEAQEKGESGSDIRSDFLANIRRIAEGDNGEQEQTSENTREEGALDSVAALFEARRKLQFGDGYEENGGEGVVAFPSYDDLYGFLKGNSGIENCRSKLYEYSGVFYLQIIAGKKSAYRLTALDSLAAEYRGVCVPSSIVLPILEEYGEVVFERGAMKKIRESLG